MATGFRWLTVSLVAISLTGIQYTPAQAAHRWTNLIAHAQGTEAPHARLRDKWALLIGVDRFQDPAVAPNKEAANNVAALHAVLVDPNAGKFAADHVRDITGQEATASGITRVLDDWLAKKALPDDMVFIYFCSVVNKGANGDPIAFSFDTLGSESELSGIDLNSLLSDIKKRTQSHYLLCALDTSPAPGSEGMDLSPLANTGVSVLSATDGHERSLNNGVTGSSVFVHHLGEALRHDGGGRSVRAIYTHVRQTVSDDAQLAFKTKQTPMLALAPETMIADVPVGIPVKSSSPPHPVKVGHPLGNLALDRPDLIPPRDGGNGAAAQKQNTAPSSQHPAAAAPSSPRPAAAAKPAPVQKPAHDDIDDEEEAFIKHPVDYSGYMAKMRQDIQKKWTPPKGLEDRKVVVVFSIHRDGRISDAHIVEGSGSDEIDKTALDALKAASPLDPLPVGSPLSIDIKYKFDWNVKRSNSQ